MRVIIKSEGFIPGLGEGPFLKPIEIPDDKFYLYKRMGLEVINVSEKVPMSQGGIYARENTIDREPIKIVSGLDPNIKTNDVKISPTVKSTIKEDEVEEVVSVDTTETEDSEDMDEVEPTEVSIEKESEEEETSDDEIDLEAMTKREIISLLNDNGIEVDNKLNKNELINFAEENLS